MRAHAMDRSGRIAIGERSVGAHARDELGITDTRKPRPLQAGLASAGTFAIGALLPLLAAAFAPAANVVVFFPYV